jgi:hypothetical protein
MEPLKKFAAVWGTAIGTRVFQCAATLDGERPVKFPCAWEARVAADRPLFLEGVSGEVEGARVFGDVADGGVGGMVMPRIPNDDAEE